MQWSKEFWQKALWIGLYTFSILVIALWEHLHLSSSWIKIAVLVCLGVAIVITTTRNQQNEQEEKVQKNVSKQEYEKVLQMYDDFETVTLRIADLSSKQIVASREQTQDAIVTLSKRFKNLVEQINIALLSSRETTKKFESKHETLDLLEIFDNSKARLDKVVENRKNSRNTLLAQVQELANQINSLGKLTEEIEIISSRTGLLALNASIEASRAGKNGLSFTVVANEVRTLSQKTTKITKDITDAVDDISESMSETVINAISVSEQDTITEMDAHETINKVLKDIHQLTMGLSESSDFLREESLSIRNEISDILVALQFQDRTSQILTHVCNSYAMFGKEVEMARSQRKEGEIHGINSEGIMRELKKGYTTGEQHRIHGGEAAGEVMSEEIDYF